MQNHPQSSASDGDREGAGLTAETALPVIVQALGGRRCGRGWSAHCPCHGDRHRSLSVGVGRSGGVVVCCHAGCAPLEIIAHLRERRLWPDQPLEPAKAAQLAVDDDAYRRQRHREAARLWSETVPLELTPGEMYLRHWRAIDAPLGPRLRWHWGQFAVVALITEAITDTPIGVQVTPLSRATNKREGSRQIVGASANGIIKLVGGDGLLVLGEGVETTLSGYELTGAKAAWCGLSVGHLKTLRLPRGITGIGLLVDPDPKGQGEAACRTAAERFHAADPRRRITLFRLRRLPHPFGDFNDLARHSRGLP